MDRKVLELENKTITCCIRVKNRIRNKDRIRDKGHTPSGVPAVSHGPVISCSEANIRTSFKRIHAKHWAQAAWSMCSYYRHKICLNDHGPVALTFLVMKCWHRLYPSSLKNDQFKFASRRNGSTADVISLALYSALDHLDTRNTYARLLSPTKAQHSTQSSPPNSSPRSNTWVTVPAFATGYLYSSSADLNQRGIITSPPH